MIGRRQVLHGAAALAATWAVPAVAQGVRPQMRRRWGDDDPVDWPGKTPDRYAVHGVDLSRFQGAVNWRQAASAGVQFAFAKATEGGDLLDPTLADNLAGAHAAGIPVGAYHFYYFCTDAATQARWFIRNVPRRRIDLPPVLDLEWNHLSPTCQKRPNGAEVRRLASQFIAILSDHYGQRPIIYTTPEFWRQTGIARLGGEFWLRSVADHPEKVYPGARWTFWQYSGTGRVPGFAGRVDLNAFAGDARAWQNWLARRRVR